MLSIIESNFMSSFPVYKPFPFFFSLFFSFLFFSFLIPLSRTSSTYRKGVVRRDILVSWLILVGRLWVSHHEIWCYLQVVLSSWSSSPQFLFYWEVISWIGVGFCQMFLSAYWYVHMIFSLFWYFDVMGYIN